MIVNTFIYIKVNDNLFTVLLFTVLFHIIILLLCSSTYLRCFIHTHVLFIWFYLQTEEEAKKMRSKTTLCHCLTLSNIRLGDQNKEGVTSDQCDNCRKHILTLLGLYQSVHSSGYYVCLVDAAGDTYLFIPPKQSVNECRILTCKFSFEVLFPNKAMLCIFVLPQNANRILNC